jgi:DNA-binding NarL/FixJ family response regulator
MKPITVLLADDHTIVREGMRSLLESESDMQLVGEAEDGHQAVSLTKRLVPDLLVMDIAMPRLNGLEATRQLLQSKCTTKILILSAHSDDAYVENVMSLGASGYLVKQSAFQVLAKAIRTVHSGGTYFSPTISKHLRVPVKAITPRTGKAKLALNTLTPREMEVLQLIAEGNTNKMSADILHISIKTVEKHRQKVMEKLDIHDTASLTRYAIAHGIIESSVQVTIL